MQINRRAAFRQLAGVFGAAPFAALAQELMDPINVFDFQALAKKKLDPLAWDYLEGGSEDEASLHDNRAGFRNIIIRPRMLVDTHKIDLKTKLLGLDLDYPILLDPAGGKNCFFPKGELEVSRAAGRANALHITNGGIEETLQAGTAAKNWWQLTTGGILTNKARTRTFVKRLEDQGCKGICFTVDIMHVSHRERDIHNGLERAWCETGLPKREANGKLPAAKNPWRTGIYPTKPEPLPTWETLQDLCAATPLPVIVKGIMTAEDGDRCVRYGAKACIVSNHGARQQDHVGGTIEALPEVVKAVNGRIPVLVDGGFRRGTDILKGLALGASAVCIARPYLYGMACFGQAGVERVLELLKVELALNMGLAGVPNMRSIDRSLVRIRP
jgi:isopentenyl diphosphate isomerase/L-lactate dehydrogenase-like FMN-dependent dehydrogenase